MFRNLTDSPNTDLTVWRIQIWLYYEYGSDRITNTDLTVLRIRIWPYYQYGSDCITNTDLTVLPIQIWLYYQYRSDCITNTDLTVLPIRIWLYPNTNRNVDVPELGSSRYIETRSPVASNYHQCNQVHPIHLLHHVLLHTVSSNLRSPINRLWARLL